MSGGMRQPHRGPIGISCEPRLLIAESHHSASDLTIHAHYLNLLRELQRPTARPHLHHHNLGIVAKIVRPVR